MDLSQFGLKPLSLSDKPFIDNALKSVNTKLSAYSFIAHFIWRDIFQFHWGIIDDHFCLFAVYGDYIYMPIPPSIIPPTLTGGGEGVGELWGFPYEHYAKVISTVFSIVHKINNNPAVSRVENIDESLKEVFLSMGYNLKAGDFEYVYRREDLVTMKGNLYKSKRAVYNYFIKNYQYSYEEFQPAHAEDCLRLFEQWKINREKKLNDALYHALLEDASYAHKQAIENFDALSLTGRVVQVDKRIEGYTFGFGRGDAFYILMEITNPEIKGLSQFIFREFCRELSDYRFINILGDSGLTNLRNVKLSYRPERVMPAYIAYS